MFELNVRSNIDKVLKDFERDMSQVPFATSVALNNTMDVVAKRLTGRLSHYFDRPTPFTKAAFINRNRRFKGKRSTKRNLVARLQPGKKQAEYLSRQIHGGTRRPRKRALVVPAGAPRNKYGNMPRNKVKRMLADKARYFSGKPKGSSLPPGIYRRMGTNKRRGGGAIRLEVLYTQRARYSKRYPFYEDARRVALREFNRQFKKAYRQALRTRR